MPHRWSPGDRRARLQRPLRLLALTGALLGAAAATTPADAAPTGAARSAAAWQHVSGTPATTHNGRPRALAPRRFRAFALDRTALAGVLDTAPTAPAPGRAARTAPLTVSVPAPDGGFERFAVQESSVMAPGLAAAHPEIRTYSGTGVDDPAASVRLDLTPLGFHAAVRAPGGSWYVDPYYRQDQSRYVSYRGSDLTASPHGRFDERDLLTAAADAVTPARAAAAGGPLRTYRLALLSDPAFASYYGSAGVTAAKVTLVNRVDEIYEDDLAVHLQLIDGTDALNLDTTAKMTGANGPCGPAACYATTDAAGCENSTLDRNQFVLGQLVGASAYDVGHLAMGVDGGGLAALGVVGAADKAAGCTGVTQPVGDLYAVDYLAHELGHQFDADHTFAGAAGSCSGNGSGTAGVEPGSGSTIMAYAGICGADNLQPHSDPYFSQRSIEQIGAYVVGVPGAPGETQGVSLAAGYATGDSFQLTFGGGTSAPIARGVNYTVTGVKNAIQAIPGWPAGVVVTVRSWDGSTSTLTPAGFRVSFSGSVDRPALAVVNPVGFPAGSTVAELVQGGATRNGGATSALGDSAPDVTAPADATIPVRTPFALTGEGTDADGDTLTYLWEQNDAASGQALLAGRTSGPLFRVFGSAAPVSSAASLTSPAPGENAAGTSPTRAFPDLAQLAAGDTNAATGACPAGDVDCFSELLPTAASTGPLHFRLTARDGRGGVSHADTQLALASAAGPFRVSAPTAGTMIAGNTPVSVAWSVAGTNLAPVSTSDVRITLSTDGGLTFPTVLAASTPNDGAASVTVPGIPTTHARVRVEAVGNVFFDVSHADFSITPGALSVANDAPGGEARAQYTDAPDPAVTVTATDGDTDGAALSATASGLPAGLSLVAGPGTAGPPGARTWTVAGTTTADPGSYPVTVTVDDADGHSAQTAFDVVVSPEDARVAYTGDITAAGTAGAATATVQLRAAVTDGAVLPGATDVSAGAVTGATVTFSEGATTLCSATVTAGATPGTGTAGCTAALATGAAHHLVATVTGRYTGSGGADVQIGATPPAATTTTPTPAGPDTGTPGAPAPATTTPPADSTPAVDATPPDRLKSVAPAPAVLGPDLAKVARRLPLSAAGRVTLKLACRVRVSGVLPARCTGRLTLSARIKGRRTTIGSVAFSLAPGGTKAVSVRLSARARTVLRRATATTLTVSITNPGRTAAKATTSVTLVPRAR